MLAQEHPARTPLELLLARVPVPALLGAAGLGWRAVERGDRIFIVDSLWRSGQRPFMLGDYVPWPRSPTVKSVWARLHLSTEVRAAIEADAAPFPGGDQVFGRVEAVTVDWKKPDRAVISREFNRFRGHTRAIAQGSDDIVVLFDVEHPNVIAAWSCPEFTYVKAVFRGHQLEGMLDRFWHGE